MQIGQQEQIKVGLATGLTKTNSTWYHAFAILNLTSGVVDVWFDTSLTPTLPTGYTKIAPNWCGICSIDRNYITIYTIW